MANHSIKIVLCSLAFGLLLGTTALAQTDEELREEIRKEVREELRKHEEAKALEERKARIRKEELLLEREREQKLEDERRLAKRAEEAKIEKKPVDDKLVRRLSGWSISAHFGPNVPLGRLAMKDYKTGYFGALGIAATLNNTIQFGKVMGIHIGLGYDSTPIDGYGYAKAVSDQNQLSAEDEIRYETVQFAQYTVRVGPVVRAMGRGAAFHFRPYIGLNVITGGEYAYGLYRGGTYSGSYSLVYKTTSAFLVGTALDLSIHVGRSSDIVVGVELNMVWRDIFFEQSGSLLPQTTFKSEQGEFIRLAPMIGYRFHL